MNTPFAYAFAYIIKQTPECNRRDRDAGTGRGQEGQLPPCLLLEEARRGKVPFKYKEYYITVNFQGAFS